MLTDLQCTLVAQNLCENCQRAGRAQCVPHVPWRNIRATQSTTHQVVYFPFLWYCEVSESYLFVQSFTEGPLSRSIETPTSGTNAMTFPQAYNHNNVGIQIQQWQG